MPKIALILILALSTSAWSSDDIVIVGYPTMAKLSDKPCSEYLPKDDEAEASGLKAICMDRVFYLSYDVREVLEGSFDGDSIDVIDFYHYYGLPDHLYVIPACVRISRGPGSLIHQETQPAVKKEGGYHCEHVGIE